MLQISHVSRVHVFDIIWCPVCGKRNFVSLDFASVWCDHCNAKFEVRSTAGDPGFVVDCTTKDVSNVLYPQHKVIPYREWAKKILPNGSAYYMYKEGEEDDRSWIIGGPGLEYLRPAGKCSLCNNTGSIVPEEPGEDGYYKAELCSCRTNPNTSK